MTATLLKHVAVKTELYWWEICDVISSAFGLAGDSLPLYRVAVRVGVHQLTAFDLTAENKLTLCNQILHDISEGLTLYAQVGLRIFDSLLEAMNAGVYVDRGPAKFVVHEGEMRNY